MAKQGIDLGEIPEAERPIGDADWFKMSRTWISGYEARLKEQVEGLQGAVKWFFTISSSATIISVAFKTPHINFVTIILLSVALLSLLVVFSLSTLAITLVSKSLEQPENPDCIREEFNRSNALSRILVVSASILLVVGMAIFPIAVITAFEQQPREIDSLTTSFIAKPVLEVDKSDPTKRFIAGIEISGVVADSSVVRLKLEKGKNLFTAIAIDSISHPLHHPRFDLSITLKNLVMIDSGENYYVTLLEKNDKGGAKSQTIKMIISNP